MKAIRVHRYGGPEVLQWEEVEAPPVDRGQVLLATEAVGINPVDTYNRSGTQGYTPPLPWVPGRDAAGTVQIVGPGVDGLQPGDRVYCDGSLSGTYAEQILCRADQVHHLPDTLTMAQGACLGTPYVTAFRALFQRGGASLGERVLIHGGSGAVGLAAVQMASANGLQVAATASTDAGRALAQTFGAQAVFDHRDTDHFDQALAWTGGIGFDLLVELLANVNLGRDLPIMARYGRVVVVGSRGRVEINPRDTMGKDLDIRGMALSNLSPKAVAQIHQGLAVGMASGWVTPHVARTLPLANAAEAHEGVHQPHLGNLVLVV